MGLAIRNMLGSWWLPTHPQPENQYSRLAETGVRSLGDRQNLNRRSPSHWPLGTTMAVGF